MIYENNVRISELSNEVQSLQRSIAETKAAGTAKSVTGNENVALRRIIAKKIAAGVGSEQIIASMQALGKPLNCREIARHDVASPLYAGQSQGHPLRWWVETTCGRKRWEKGTARYSMVRSISRSVSGGFSSVIKNKHFTTTIIPTEDWILKLRLENSLNGHITSMKAAYFADRAGL